MYVTLFIWRIHIFFLSIKALLRLQIVSGERPFVCGLCNKGFNVKSNLLRHLRTLHDQLISAASVEGDDDEAPGPSEVKRESWGRGGGLGRARGRRAGRDRGALAGRPASVATALPRKQSYSLFLKQRAVLFSAKKWKQWDGPRYTTAGLAID